MRFNAEWLKSNLPAGVQRPLRTIKHRLDFRLMSRNKLLNFSMAQHLRAILESRRIDCVLDVGANEGQFGTFLRDRVGYKGQIISFEPVSSAFAALQQQAAQDSLWKVHKCGIGAESGEMKINVSRSSVFSSFLDLQKATDLFEGISDVAATEIVMVERLDSFLDQIGNTNVFLKTDTQGFDREVLQGAAGILENIQGVQVELSFVPVYENMPSYKEMLQELEGRGFVVSNMFPISLADLRAVEMDCLLVREMPLHSGEHCSYETVLTAPAGRFARRTNMSRQGDLGAV